MIGSVLTGLVINAALTPAIIRLAHRKGWYDHHNDRKIHTVSTPRLGGVGIFWSFMAAAAVGAVLLRDQHASAGLGRAVFLLLGAATIHGLGLYDDFVNLRAPLKFGMQLFAAALVVFSGVRIRALDLPWIQPLQLPTWLGALLTVLWIVSMTNAQNLIDGADGLSGGVALIAVMALAAHAWILGNDVALMLSAGLIGTLAGFLLFNAPPARVFMGDSGSLSLGFFVAVLAILAFEHPVHGLGYFPPIPIMSIVFVPVMDTTMAIVRRKLQGLPVHAADRLHIHHRLIDHGWSGWRLLLVVSVAMLPLGALSLSWHALGAGMVTAISLCLWFAFLVALRALRVHRAAEE